MRRTRTTSPLRSAARSRLLRTWLAVVALLTLPAISQAQTETIEYYATDAIGSIRVVFGANGMVLGRQDYGPFGSELLPAPTLPPERFGGQEKDAETDQGYFHARQYQSRTGRFTRVDPIYAGLFEPQRLNRYSYALNSPLTYVDPTGLDACGTRPDGTPKFCGGTVETWVPTAVDVIWTKANDWGIGGIAGGPPGQVSLAESFAGRGSTPPPVIVVPTSEPPPSSPPGTPPETPAGPEECNPNIPSDMGGCLPLSPEGARKTIDCARSHYGLTAAAAVSGILATPVPKGALALPVLGNASRYTNPIGLISYYLFPNVDFGNGVRRMGTMNKVRALGRANVRLSPFIVITDLFVIHGCVTQ